MTETFTNTIGITRLSRCSATATGVVCARITSGWVATSSFASESYLSEPPTKSLFARDCVVADAVAVEPVSQVQFPANRENNREF